MIQYRKSYKRRQPVILQINVNEIVRDMCLDCDDGEVEDIALIVAKRFNYDFVYEEIQELVLDVLDEIFIEVDECRPKKPIYDDYSDPWGGH
tara:strand:- start:108 stop:383 length:276 start_codon:yes stop_codon:yes gene_type:complete